MRVAALLTSLLFLAVSASAVVLLPLAPPRDLGRRQLTISPVAPVPSACSSICAPVNDQFNRGCPVTSCCTTTFETQYYNCLDCVGSALDASSYAAAQDSLNLLYTTCVDTGFILQPLALPGQSASGSNSTTSAPPDSTVAPSPTGSSTGTNSHTSGATVYRGLRGGQAEAWIGAVVFLSVARLW